MFLERPNRGKSTKMESKQLEKRGVKRKGENYSLARLKTDYCAKILDDYNKHS